MMKNIVLGMCVLILSMMSIFSAQNQESNIIICQLQLISISEEQLPDEAKEILIERNKEEFQKKYSTSGRQPTEEEIRNALGIKEEPKVYRKENTYRPIATQHYSTSGAASTIWNTLISSGYSSCAAAGIMGNIMAEVGGQSFDIQYWLTGEGGNYYGICQWSRYYFPEVYGTDLATQLNYLINSISSGLKSDLNNAGSPSSAAYIFASRYERCASWSYGQRQSNAERAYYNFT